MINDKFLKEQKILHLGTIDPERKSHILFLFGTSTNQENSTLELTQVQKKLKT